MDLKLFTKEEKYLMLALDHRGSIKKLMNPDNPEAVTDEQVVQLKKEIIDAVKDQMSGVLIDQTIGLQAYPNKEKPFLLPVEKSGYTDQVGERVTELEYTVVQLKEMGAAGAKLLLYFNPHYESFQKQIEIALKVQQECRELGFPYFLEIRVYTKEDPEMKTPRGELVILSLRELMNAGVKPDVWKLEYPGNKDGCGLITQQVNVTPWILLTKGSTFDDFKVQLREAVESGCVGFLAGRALWQDVCSLQGEEKHQFLSETLPNRFREISQIVTAS